MKEFNIAKFEENEIQLMESKYLEDLYKTIIAEEDFIVHVIDGENKYSKIVIGLNLTSKVKSGEFILSSQ